MSTVLTQFQSRFQQHGHRHPERFHRRRERREARAERRRLRRTDALTARLGELHAIQELLDQAADVVQHGWVQGAWFTVDDGGRTRVVPTAGPRSLTGPVTGACLVGSVVAAAGGPRTMRSQLVRRTLELVWHTLRDDGDRDVHWCPGPDLRTMHVLELTHWNDSARRTQPEVVGLLVAAGASAEREREQCRAELSGSGTRP